MPDGSRERLVVLLSFGGSFGGFGNAGVVSCLIINGREVEYFTLSS